MPVLHAEIIIGEEQIIFSTRTNGDSIEIKNIDMDEDNAANLARLINMGVDLKIEISEA